MISIKSKKEIEAMTESGKILADVHAHAKSKLRVGMTTYELDQIIAQRIEHFGAKASFKGYQDFPGSSCLSINEVVIHGIPDQTRLQDGDLLSIDIGVLYQGFHTDAARTYTIGKPRKEDLALIEACQNSFFQALEACKVGGRVLDISHEIETFLQPTGYGIVREFTGHGVGRSLHESPSVPNYGERGRGARLQAGMTLAIEPMITAGKETIEILDDGWTVVTKDRSRAAHYENTICINEESVQILTLGDEDRDG